jgi:hypothetical protein
LFGWWQWLTFFQGQEGSVLNKEAKAKTTKWVRVRVLPHPNVTDPTRTQVGGLGWAEWSPDLAKWWVSFDDTRAYSVSKDFLMIQLDVESEDTPPKFADRPMVAT